MLIFMFLVMYFPSVALMRIGSLLFVRRKIFGKTWLQHQFDDVQLLIYVVKTICGKLVSC